MLNSCLTIMNFPMFLPAHSPNIGRIVVYFVEIRVMADSSRRLSICTMRQIIIISQVMRWETDAETVEVRFIGSTIFEADWTERSTGRTEHRSFIVGSGGSGSPQTLYDTYVALRSGMTKSEVVALAPVVPSQGSDTEQVLWVLGEEALGVMFNGASNSSAISFAQWGLSIAAGGQTESRSF